MPTVFSLSVAQKIQKQQKELFDKIENLEGHYALNNCSKKTKLNDLFVDKLKLIFLKDFAVSSFI